MSHRRIIAVVLYNAAVGLIALAGYLGAGIEAGLAVLGLGLLIESVSVVLLPGEEE